MRWKSRNASDAGNIRPLTLGWRKLWLAVSSRMFLVGVCTRMGIELIGIGVAESQLRQMLPVYEKVLHVCSEVLGAATIVPSEVVPDAAEQFRLFRTYLTCQVWDSACLGRHARDAFLMCTAFIDIVALAFQKGEEVDRRTRSVERARVKREGIVCRPGTQISQRHAAGELREGLSESVSDSEDDDDETTEVDSQDEDEEEDSDVTDG
jgi:hypothetical protein